MQKNTICWNCAKACRKCPWSRNFEPVSGWKATPTKVYVQEGVFNDSFIVHECPLFEKENKLVSVTRVSVRWLAQQLGIKSARTISRMAVEKLLQKCANIGLDIEIKYYNGNKQYFLKSNKRKYFYLPKSLINEFFAMTGNAQF